MIANACCRFMEIGSEKWNIIIRQGAKTVGIDVSDEQLKLFAAHARELINWNRKINLTAITDPFEIAVKHIVDSLAPAVMIFPHDSMLDIGSGGGFPGIPLKILMPTLSVTLIDASRKKVSFLNHVLRTLKLDNMDVHQIRGEDIILEHPEIPRFQKTQLEFRRPSFNPIKSVLAKPFDIVISRALASLNDFITMALPALKKDGLIVAMKGKVSEPEIESVRLALSRDSIASTTGSDNFSVTRKTYKLPFIASERSLISIRRMGRSTS